MTCASCANRIERKLNKLDGVTATVNYATEKAKVDLPRRASRPSDLVGTVEQAGYGASAAARRPSRRGDATPDDPTRALRAAAARLGRADRAGVAMAMVPACSSPTGSGSRSPWPRRSWCGARWPFHRAAWTNLRHGTSTMDTLISLGTLAAFGWSLYALFLGTRARPG